MDDDVRGGRCFLIWDELDRRGLFFGSEEVDLVPRGLPLTAGVSDAEQYQRGVELTASQISWQATASINRMGIISLVTRTGLNMAMGGLWLHNTPGSNGHAGPYSRSILNSGCPLVHWGDSSLDCVTKSIGRDQAFHTRPLRSHIQGRRVSPCGFCSSAVSIKFCPSIAIEVRALTLDQSMTLGHGPASL